MAKETGKALFIKTYWPQRILLSKIIMILSAMVGDAGVEGRGTLF